MASMYPPKKNTAFTLYFTLYKNDGTVIANPGTITKKYSIDGGAVADISTAITEEDTTYGQCSLAFTASEMNGDAIWYYIKDDTTGCVPITGVFYTAAQTLDEVYTRLGAPAGASLAADLVTIDNFVDDLEARLTSTRAGYLDNLQYVTAAPPTAAAVADAVWDEATSGHTTAGSYGKTSEWAGASAASVADAIWDEAWADHQTAGSFGNKMATESNLTNVGLVASGIDTKVGTAYNGSIFQSIERVENLAIGIDSHVDIIHDAVLDLGMVTGALGALAESATVANGSETGTYANTHAADGNYHIVTAAAGTIDYYYTINCGAGNVPLEVSVNGRLHEGSAPSGGDSVDIYAWDYIGGAWEHISPPSGDFVGVASSTSADDTVKTMPLFSKHTLGGEVKIRLAGTSLETNTALYVNQMYVSYASMLSETSITTAVWSAGLSDYSGLAGTAGKALYDLPTAGAIADAVWDEVASGHITNGSTGYKLSTIPTAALNAGAVWSLARAGNDLTGTFGATSEWAGTAPSAATIADAVWDEAASGHTTAGTFGKALNDVETGATPADIAAAVWDEPESSHQVVGSMADMLLSTVPSSIITSDSLAHNIADHVWDEATAGHTTNGTFGKNASYGEYVAGVVAGINNQIIVIDGIVDQILDDTGTSGVMVATGAKAGYTLSSEYDPAKGAAQATALTNYANDIEALIVSSTEDLAMTAELPTVGAIATGVWADVVAVEVAADAEAARVAALAAQTAAEALPTDLVSETFLTNALATLTTQIDRIFGFFFRRRVNTNSSIKVYQDDGVTLDADIPVSGDDTYLETGPAQ